MEQKINPLGAGLEKVMAGELGGIHKVVSVNELEQEEIKALKELGIISPQAQLHITKAQVKELAAWYGISVAARPSAPCMATRLPYHTEIVRIEVDRESMGTLLEKSREVISGLKELGFSYITMDLEGFRSGSMDVGLEPSLE